MGHFLLTKLLMDRLKSTSESRIVNLSSLAHGMGSNSLDVNDLMWNNRKYNDMTAYAASKLANIYFTKHQAKIFEQDGVNNVKVVSLHPGFVRTDLARSMNKCVLTIQWILCFPCIMLVTKSPF